jgi:hypothetical protein
MASNSTASSLTNPENGGESKFNKFPSLIDDVCAIDLNTIRPPKVKDEDKKTFETLMKRVNTNGSNVDEDGIPLK